ncbi:MAG TPA: acyl-CoA dehydrogenase family protein [Microbacteriaceae bacterium]|nr:acyl-CoA dehydrogenase family protein [Microbacteriaceae bacterium]
MSEAPTLTDTDAAASTSLREFEARARAFLEEHVPRRDTVVVTDTMSAEVVANEQELQKKIYDAGFAAITQPKEHGGQGLGEAESMAWGALTAGYAVPRMLIAISHGMCGPIINLLGTPEQKAKYLPDLWRANTLFAQIFSEPGAGSDVAGLQTRAEKVDGGWLMTGQKVWTSNAQYCDYGVIVARTNPDVPKHQGITMFIINLRDPAVTIRPLRVATGEYPFNEIFIDSLFIPDSDRIGEVDKGWDAAVAMLRFERISIGTSSTKSTGPLSFEKLADVAREAGLAQDPAARAALVEAHVLEQGTDLLALRMREEVEAGIDLGPRGSIAKLAGASANFRVNEIISDIAGLSLVAWDGPGAAYPPLTKAFTGAPSSWTAGGTIEIQLGIVGERVLGLEKDPSVDRGVPFRDIRRSA